MRKRDKRGIYAWALYDWANSAFATAVMAGFFPVFFRQYWSSAADVTVATFRLGLANTLASLVIALSAPLLGAVSDIHRKKKAFLAAFALLGITATGGLFFVPEGRYLAAMSLYVAATLGFMGGNVFYDSLLLDVAPVGALDRVSALGYALGYIGGGILFAGCVCMALSPETFGFATRASATRAAFMAVAAWWGLFSIPLFACVRPAPGRVKGITGNSIQKWGRSLLETLGIMTRDRNVVLFLLGYWLYIDGVGTVIRMAVDYGMAIGLKPRNLILALLVTQFVGFPATLVFGRIGERWGPKRGILLGLAGYLAIVAGSLIITRGRDFMMLAVAVGLVQGGVQSLSRSLFARLVPRGREATFFGVYNMLGRFAAVLGPVLMGATAFLTKAPRLGILSVGVLFLGGACFLSLVREKT